MDTKQLAQELSVSQSIVSRMENCHKLITLPIAEKLSLIFHVDAGLLCLISSTIKLLVYTGI